MLQEFLHPVQIVIRHTETIGFFPKKNIPISAIAARNWVYPATIDGLNLSASFPPIKFPITMPAPANIIRLETNEDLIPERFTSSGFM